ncbi:hypothetical protein OG607_12420 [Streptomyces sp. NBC_01537]
MAESDMLTLDVLFDRLEQMPVPEGYKVEIVGGSIFLPPQCRQHWDIITNPVDSEYKDEVTVTFGKPLDLTDTVVGLTLTTDDFEDD